MIKTNSYQQYKQFTRDETERNIKLQNFTTHDHRDLALHRLHLSLI